MPGHARGTHTLDREKKEVISIKEGESAQHQKYQEVALKFSSKKLNEGLTILFDRNIDHSLAGDRTVILSSEHATIFEHLKPKVSEVISAGDLPPEEIAELRRENLSSHDANG